MRRILTFCAMALAIAVPQIAHATYIFQEQFSSYGAGTNLNTQPNPFGNGNWTRVSGNTVNPCTQVGTTSLVYSGITGTAGGYTQITGVTSGEDPACNFNSTSTSLSLADGSSFYYSAILNCTSVPTVAGDYIMWIGTANTTSVFRSKLFVAQGSDTSHWKIGVSQQANAGAQVFASNDLPLNTPVFIVVSYDAIAGTDNNTARLWINPTLGLGSAPTPDATSTDNAAGTDLATFGRIGLRNASTVNGTVQVDEIKVTDNWAQAASTASMPVTVSTFSIE